MQQNGRSVRQFRLLHWSLLSQMNWHKADIVRPQKSINHFQDMFSLVMVFF